MKNYDCIFLDRDGTINSDSNGYISSLQNFNLYDFTIPALKRLSELGNKFCIITNQSGISRGLIKEKNLKLHQYVPLAFFKYIDFSWPNKLVKARGVAWGGALAHACKSQ